MIRLLNLIAFSILSFPCLLVVNDNENSWYLNFLGLIYCVWYVNKILKPIFKAK